jgi:hypothetical protein
MWLYIFVIPLAIVMLIGGLLAGGIFTIVFLPIAIIITAMAIAFAMYGKSSRRRTLPSAQAVSPPPPDSGHVNVAESPNQPGDLVDARRGVQ